MRLREIMESDVPSVERGAPLKEAARLRDPVATGVPVAARLVVLQAPLEA